jgi:citrate synthase
MTTATETNAAAAGLRGVVAAQSAIGDVNGEEGKLIYQGYDIHDLAENSTFEEVVFLLWNERLPKADELKQHVQEIRALDIGSGHISSGSGPRQTIRRRILR